MLNSIIIEGKIVSVAYNNYTVKLQTDEGEFICSLDRVLNQLNIDSIINSYVRFVGRIVSHPIYDNQQLILVEHVYVIPNEKKTFNFTITETYKQTFGVEATDEDEAKSILINKYNNEEIHVNKIIPYNTEFTLNN